MTKRFSIGLLTVLVSTLALPALAQAWTTECKDQRCGISINVNDEAKKQRLLTLALLLDKDGSDPAVLLTTPLGVALEPGVRLIMGQREIGLKFKVCYPDGCQAHISLVPADLADLRAAANVDARFFVLDNDKALSAKIDLAGLGAAIDEAMK